MERLQKIVAHAGLASRREAERWIVEGRVTVNGAIVRELGTRADPAKDSIKVDGKRIKPAGAPLYFALHKPPGVVTTLDDPQGRPDLKPFLRSLGEKSRVYPVGRLDFNSSGLLLLTNDGELAQRLMHPRFGVVKIYHVKLSSCPTTEQLAALRKGIRLEDGITAPARARVLQRLKKNAWVEIELREGRKREVRRMFLALGFFVEKLVRVRVGAVALGQLAPGELRPLSISEVAQLKQSVGLDGNRVGNRRQARGSSKKPFSGHSPQQH
ncbi:MAG TPA: pseudouridine synthase [Candidatus Binatia bacterium]|nr:pseudouridine synthase [Candidatus Binatia bacterium]